MERVYASFLSRRDLQFLLVEPCLKPKTAKFCRPSQRIIIDGFYYRVRYKVLCEWGGFVALFVDQKWRSLVLIKLELEFFLIYIL